MRHIVLLGILLSGIFILSCGGPSGNSNNPSGELREASGGKFYGGVFKMNETEYLRSLYPLNITEVTGHRIVNQIYEGLVELNQGTLEVQPALAESWEIDSTATVFTFKIREGVTFHDDPCFADGKGRTVTAHDFKYVFDHLCEPDVNNQGYKFFKNKLKGAEDYYKSVESGNPLEGGVSGVTVIDDQTLQLELIQPFSSFLQLLAMPFVYAYPKEAIDAYGLDMRINCVGTGPFQLKALKEDEAVILSRNDNYWGVDEHGNQLPYLDGIKVTFIKEKKSELLAFRKGDLDMVFRLPLEMIDEVLGSNEQLTEDYAEYELQVKPSLSLQYYGFLHPDELFADINVRKAFNYAVDREKICDFTLKGSGIPAHYGIVPPAFANYDAEAVNGYQFNPDKARKHMELAGYPNGDGFPEITLQINSGGGRNEQVAEAIQKMLQENLNITVQLSQLPWAQHLENVETSKVQFWRLGWVADYPDPENFLNLFLSEHVPPNADDRSYLNSIRYKSEIYDSLYYMAMQTVDEDQRNLLFLRADQQAMDDAIVLAIYYDKDYRLLQGDVRDFPQNPMEYRLLHEVYFVPGEEEANAGL